MLADAMKHTPNLFSSAVVTSLLISFSRAPYYRRYSRRSLTWVTSFGAAGASFPGRILFLPFFFFFFFFLASDFVGRRPARFRRVFGSGAPSDSIDCWLFPSFSGFSYTPLRLSVWPIQAFLTLMPDTSQGTREFISCFFFSNREGSRSVPPCFFPR